LIPNLISGARKTASSRTDKAAEDKDQQKSAGSRARSIARFFLAPELGSSVAPLRDRTGMNIIARLVAILFARQGLFDPAHPGLSGRAPLTIGAVFGEARLRLKFTPQGLPQVIFFGAILAMLVLIVLTFITGLMMFLVGTANAQPVTNSGVFEPLDTNNDLALKFINYFFEGTGIALSGNIQIEPGAIQKALAAMLAFYSNGILIIASVILLYHLVAMVAETAHQGAVMGKRANQIWAPIRLIVAIGLLVPLASGMNSGQYIIVQIAKWGSGMASQAWGIFNVALNNTEFNIKIPNDTEVRQHVLDLLQIATCEQGFNYIVDQAVAINPAAAASFSRYRIIPIESVETTPGKPASFFSKGTPPITHYRVYYGNATLSNMCGSLSYRIPSGMTANSGVITGSPGTEAEAILKAQIETSREYFNLLRPIAGQIGRYFIGGAAERSQELPSNEIAWKLVDSYQQTLRARIAANVQPFVNKNVPIDTRGWFVAGVYFNELARRQQLVYQATSAFPTIGQPQAALPELYETDDLIREVNSAMIYNDKWFIDTAQNLPPTNQSSTTTQIVSRDTNMTKTGNAITDALDRAAKDAGIWDETGMFGRLLYSATSLNAQLDANNAITALASIGWAKLDLAWKIVALATVAPAVGAVVGRGFSLGFNALGLAATPALGPGAAVGGHLAGRAAEVGLRQLGSMAGLILILFALAALGAAILLAFVIPLLAFIKFSFGILTWLKSLLEGLVAIPLFALAHLTPEGDGLSGRYAEGGYFMIFQIFLRPILMVFGMILALLLLNAVIAFLNMTYLGVVSDALGESFSSANVLTKFVYAIIYAVLAYSMANSCFKLIDFIPQHALSWMGKSASNDRVEEEPHVYGTVMAFGAAATHMQFGALGSQISQNWRSLKDRDAQRLKSGSQT